jgi:hypothetical protein
LTSGRLADEARFPNALLPMVSLRLEDDNQRYLCASWLILGSRATAENDASCFFLRFNRTTESRRGCSTSVNGKMEDEKEGRAFSGQDV